MKYIASRTKIFAKKTMIKKYPKYAATKMSKNVDF